MITWNEITEELGTHKGFREALVSVFRKYEGQETDEKDKSNRTVKVTVASFARHLGIAQQTFDNWVNPPSPREVVPDPGITSPEPQEPIQPREPLTRPAPQVNPPVDPPNLSGIPVRTPAEYKRDRAEIEEMFQPLKNSINALSDSFVFTCGVSGTLEEIVDTMDRVNPQFVTIEEVKEAFEFIAQIGEKMMSLELQVNTLAQMKNEN